MVSLNIECIVMKRGTKLPNIDQHFFNYLTVEAGGADAVKDV